ncbi:MAG: aldo/keto reductase [Candidatus Heimdallarchaeaceae archaeon]
MVKRSFRDINNQGLSRRHIWQAIRGSLKRLQTEWIDLYQIHSFDNDTEIEETLHDLLFYVKFFALCLAREKNEGV